MRLNSVSFARSLLLFTIIILVTLPSTAKKASSKVTDSLAIQRWVKPIKDSIFYNPIVILPWLDSLSHFADSTQSPYANYAKNNLKGNYNWAIGRYDSAISCFNAAIQWSFVGGYSYQQINGYGNLALMYNLIGKDDSATYYYRQAIEMARKSNYDYLYIRNIINLSYIITQQGDYTDAIQLLEEAHTKNASLKDEELEAILNAAFGSVYLYLDDIKQMHHYFHLAINYHLKNNNNAVLASLYMNIAESFTLLSQNFDSSAFYFSKALEVSNPENKENVLHMIDLTKGSLFNEEANYDSATFYYLRALDSPYSNLFSRRKATLLVNVGNAYRYSKQFNTAVDYYLKGYQLSDSLGIPEYKLNALIGLVKIDSIRGDFEQAFFRNLELQQIQAKLKKDEACNQLIASEVRKELEVQNLKNEFLQTENVYQEDIIIKQRQIGMLIILALIGILGFTLIQFLSRKKIKQLNKHLNSNVSRLDAQNLELDQLNKTKDKFFSIVSHDLRSPFAALRTGMIILNTDWESLTEDEKKELVLLLNKSAENTHNLLEELLQWSMLQQGLMKLSEKTFSVSDIIHELNALFENVVSDKEIRLIIDFEQEVQLTTDYQMLKRLLHNLLTNAVKFTPRGGEIRIELRSEPGRTSITVRDTGIGIPKEKQGGIFELNSDFGRPGTEGEKGSGMGLILCMDYARLMSAKLKLESEVDRGSAFTVIYKT